jgi:hypothetical protein
MNNQTWQPGDILVFDADSWNKVYRKNSILKVSPYEVTFVRYSDDEETFSAILEGNLEDDFSIKYFEKKG